VCASIAGIVSGDTPIMRANPCTPSARRSDDGSPDEARKSAIAFVLLSS
jgi:hypothetical protein